MFVISRGRSATIECSLHTCDLWMMRWYEMHWVLSSCVGLCHPLPQWQRPSTPLVAMSVMSSNCFNCGPLSQGVQVFACKINCPLYKEIRMVHFSIIIGMFAFSEYGEITQKKRKWVRVCVCVCAGEMSILRTFWHDVCECPWVVTSLDHRWRLLGC